jgi:hypothetical protein
MPESRRVCKVYNRQVFYIAAESVASAMEPGELGGVGFPKNSVFDFDAVLFESLTAAWQRGDSAELLRLWSRATPAVSDTRLAA